MNIKNFNTEGLYRIGRLLAVVLVAITVNHTAWAGTPTTVAGPQKETRFTNVGSIANTRHNMTQDTASVEISSLMSGSRNDYGQVCVYCHTPHAANPTVAAPLWNRTIKAQTYATYDQLGTQLTQAIGTPGPNSLTCLSCHDGQTAIDSIINMPGSGMYDGAQATTQSASFLDGWPPGGGGTNTHEGLDSVLSASGFVSGNGQGSDTLAYTTSGTYQMPDGLPVIPGATVTSVGCIGNDCFYSALFPQVDGVGCLTCHTDSNGSGSFAGQVVDFRIWNIGLDLTNDHPIGITFPGTTGPGTDWNGPTGVKGTSLFFDNDSNGVMAKDEIRTYAGKVECASCHDPHGVPSAGPGSDHNPTFLRVDNSDASTVCLTCHNK